MLRIRLLICSALAIALGTFAGAHVAHIALGYSGACTTTQKGCMLNTTGGPYSFENYDRYASNLSYDAPVNLVFTDFTSGSVTSTEGLIVNDIYGDFPESEYTDVHDLDFASNSTHVDQLEANVDSLKEPDPCPLNNSNMHIRLYTPPSSYDVNLGYYVIGEIHYDYNDWYPPDAVCPGSAYFGFYEAAERDFVNLEYPSNHLSDGYHAYNEQCVCWQGSHFNDSDGWATVVQK